MKQCKVTVIGGGSSYTPELVEGFLKRYEQFPLKELVFVDVVAGEEKVKIVTALAQRMAKKEQREISISYTLDREAALQGADFVVTQLRVGQLDARILDERISNEHHLIGQETNGAGGFFKALRTVPVILEILADVKRICPEAWVINFANPSGIINQAVLEHGDFPRFISLCNVPINMQHGIAKVLNVEPQQVRLELAGLNHFFYVTDVFVEEQSRINEILEAYQDAKNHISMQNIDGIAWSNTLIQGLKALPCPYHQYYYYTKEELAKEMELYRKGEVRGEVVKQVEQALFELYQDETLQEKPKQLEKRGGALYSDAACNLIVSIFNDTRDIQYVNMRNGTTLPDLDEHSSIECAAYITKDGPIAIPVGQQPAVLRGQIQLMKAFEQATVQAAISGRTEDAIAALNLNPLIDSDSSAQAVYQALYVAHSQYLLKK
ncbi:MAG: 6-phospho-beta-glucosidase [Erysipelotrichaceae bacterium]